MMINWREIPFVRLFLPFALGIVAAEYGFAMPPIWVNVVIVLLLLILISVTVRRTEFRQRLVFGVPLSIFLFLFGSQSVFYQNELNNGQHFQKYLTENTPQIALATVTDFSEKTSNYRLIARVQKIGTAADSMHDCTGNVLIYIRKDSSDNYLAESEKRTPQYGDLILLKSQLEPVKPPKNPDAFDFKQYLHRQNVHYQLFTTNDNMSIVAERRGNPIQQLAVNWQKRLLLILKKHLTTDREFAVGSALLLGYRDAVGEDVKNAYVQTGSMHILAVSGMHILLIFKGLQLIFKFYKSGNRRFRWTKAILSLILIWLFALITGLGASVLRAAVMATFMAIGQSMQRRGNNYNILAASAFILLLWNPLLLFDVGFQLSYLCVIGIMYFQPKIKKLVISNYKFVNCAWDALSIGFAAQLVVTPLSLYYFHQFPTYFWLSGLLAVPVSSGALYAGIVLFFFDWLPYVGYILGEILFWLIFFMNEIIFLIQRFPLAIVDNLAISLIAVVLFYFALIHIILTVKSRQLRDFFIPLSILMVLCGFYAFSTIKQSEQKRIVIYHVFRNSLVDFIEGDNCFSFTKKSVNNPTVENRLKFASQNHCKQLNIKEIHTFSFGDTMQTAHLAYYKGICQFKNYRLLLVDNLPKEYIPLPVNSVLLRNNPRLTIEDLKQKVQFEQVIFDASNNRSNVEKWKTVCISLGIRFYDVEESGAWTYDLSDK